MGRATFLLPIFILLNFGKAAAQLRLQPLPNSGVKDICNQAIAPKLLQ
jgi:hypothetical protein